jgi:membrane-associated phospholipid phosphatase
MSDPDHSGLSDGARSTVTTTDTATAAAGRTARIGSASVEVADLIRTVARYSHTYRLLQPPAIEDRFASLPSLHVGWNLLVGITLATTARHRVARVIAALSPLAMAAAVVFTANHFIVDVLLGAAVALFGLVVSYRVPSWRARRSTSAPTRSGPATPTGVRRPRLTLPG